MKFKVIHRGRLKKIVIAAVILLGGVVLWATGQSGEELVKVVHTQDAELRASEVAAEAATGAAQVGAAALTAAQEAAVLGEVNSEGQATVNSAASGNGGSSAGAESSEEALLGVHVTGAVVNPDKVYFLKPGDRIADAVEAAGGALEEANLSQINLALYVQDGQRIRIPFQGEEVSEELIQNAEETVGTWIEGKIESTAGTETNSTTASGDGKAESEGTGASAGADGAQVGGDGSKTAAEGDRQETTADNSAKGLTNINLATKIELMELPGIGEAYAERIIAYREEHGGFQSIEEIKNVSGIGDAKFEKIKDLITV